MTIAVNSSVMGILIFNLCSTAGKNEKHKASFSVLFLSLCHFMNPFVSISVATFVAGILSYTMLWSSSSLAASLARLSAASLPVGSSSFGCCSDGFVCVCVCVCG